MSNVVPRCVAAAVLLAVTGAAQAEVFCVGRGTATHGSLAAAVAAAAANGPGTDYIFLDSITHAVPDRVLIENQSVEIVGGFEFCQTLLAPTGISTLDGAGGAAGSVLEVRVTTTDPQEVRFDRVTITGGENDGTGGGLHLTGTPLTVRLGPLTTISGNAANYGGGIFLGGARLHLNGASLVNNVALAAGGALDCVDTQFFVAAETSVRFNHAVRGGGYSLRDNCGAVFYGGNALSLFANEAEVEGGGLLASHSGALVQVVRGPAGAPGPIGRNASLRVAANRAGERGAGIALQQGGRLYANGITLVANNLTAPSGQVVQPLGAAIYAGGGTVLALDTDPRCAPGEACNLVLNNAIKRTAQSHAAAGAGIAAFNASVVSIRNTEFSGNTLNGGAGVASAVVLGNIESAVDLSRVLFHHNGSADGSSVPHVLQIDATPTAQLAFLTFADNALSGTGRATVRVAGVGALAWRSSVVDQPGEPTASISSSPQPVLDCLLAHELASVPGATRSFAQAAVFVDAGNEDYRPAPGSPQVDVCDGSGGALPPELDLAMQPVPADTITVDVYGPYDLGAFESQEFLVEPALFADGFESP